MHPFVLFYDNEEYKNCKNKEKFIDEIFLKDGYDNEAITVTLNGGLQGDWRVDIHYSCIKNHKQTHASTHIPQTLLLTLSNEMILSICKDLLKTWRLK